MSAGKKLVLSSPLSENTCNRFKYVQMEETHVPGSRFGNNNIELFAVAGIKFTARIRIRRMKKSQLPQDFRLRQM